MPDINIINGGYHLFGVGNFDSWMVKNEINSPHLGHNSSKAHEVSQCLSPDTELWREFNVHHYMT